MEFKETYREQVEQRLKAQEAFINALNSMIGKVDVESRDACYKKIETLESKQEILKKLLKDLKESDKDAWKKIQEIDTTMVEFKNIVSVLETEVLKGSK